MPCLFYSIFLLPSAGGDKDFGQEMSIIYPNGGNIQLDKIYYLDNPYQGYNVLCTAEIFYNNKWFDPHWYSNLYHSDGVVASQMDDSIIAVHTGNYSFYRSGSWSGGPVDTNDPLFTAPLCRVKVYKMNKIK